MPETPTPESLSEGLVKYNPYTPNDIQKIKEWFQANPDQIKMRKSTKAGTYNDLNIPYSILKTPDPHDPNGSKLFIIYATTLGTGAYGRVKIAQELESPNGIYAIKIDQNENEREKKILQDLHQLIGTGVRGGDIGQSKTQINDIEKTINSGKKSYIILPYFKGETLATIFSKPSETLKEDLFKLKALLATFKATKELHETYNIIHGDLSFNNVVLSNNGSANIIDWGFAAKMDSQCKIQLPFRIRSNLNNYHPPEAGMDPPKIDISSDLYNLGWWIRHMSSRTPNSIYNQQINSSLLNFSSKLINIQPNERLQVDECITQCELMISELESTIKLSGMISSNVLNIRKFILTNYGLQQNFETFLNNNSSLNTDQDCLPSKLYKMVTSTDPNQFDIQLLNETIQEYKNFLQAHSTSNSNDFITFLNQNIKNTNNSIKNFHVLIILMILPLLKKTMSTPQEISEIINVIDPTISEITSIRGFMDLILIMLSSSIKQENINQLSESSKCLDLALVFLANISKEYHLKNQAYPTQEEYPTPEKYPLSSNRSSPPTSPQISRRSKRKF